jgi:hypothetical protein
LGQINDSHPGSPAYRIDCVGSAKLGENSSSMGCGGLEGDTQLKRNLLGALSGGYLL